MFQPCHEVCHGSLISTGILSRSGQFNVNRVIPVTDNSLPNRGHGGVIVDEDTLLRWWRSYYLEVVEMKHLRVQIERRII